MIAFLTKITIMQYKIPKVITIDDGNIMIKCQLCNFKSSTEAEATKHVKEKHAHRCKECLTEFKTKQELINHVSTTHWPERAATQSPSAKICTNCRKEFSSEKALKTHVDTEHKSSNQRFECPICNYNSSSETDIAKHINEMHAFK